MKWHDWIYYGLFTAHVLFLCIALLRFLRPASSAKTAFMIHPKFDAPIWRGKIEGFQIEGKEAYHAGDMDLIVYSKSLFIGYADQGYPLLSLEREEVAEYWISGRELRLRAKKGDQLHMVIIHGNLGQVSLLSKKMQFLMRKRTN